MAKKTAPRRTAPAHVAPVSDRPDVLKAPKTNRQGRLSPIVQETVVDLRPKMDPRTGKAEIPGAPTSKARMQTPDYAPMRVRAIRQLYYEHKRRREGDVFTLKQIEDFNPKCHAWVSSETPERLTTSRQTIAAKHEEVLRARMGLSRPDDALPSDDDVL